VPRTGLGTALTPELLLQGLLVSMLGEPNGAGSSVGTTLGEILP
jgi:hypothetical protein